MLIYDDRNLSLTYTPERCIGCGRCQEVCPHGVFVLEETPGGPRARVVGRSRCMECGACHWNCPADALWVRRGVGCAQALVNELADRLRRVLTRPGGSLSEEEDAPEPGEQKEK